MYAVRYVRKYASCSATSAKLKQKAYNSWQTEQFVLDSETLWQCHTRQFNPLAFRFESYRFFALRSRVIERFLPSSPLVGSHVLPLCVCMCTTDWESFFHSLSSHPFDLSNAFVFSLHQLMTLVSPLCTCILLYTRTCMNGSRVIVRK